MAAKWSPPHHFPCHSRQKTLLRDMSPEQQRKNTLTVAFAKQRVPDLQAFYGGDKTVQEVMMNTELPELVWNTGQEWFDPEAKAFLRKADEEYDADEDRMGLEV